MKITVNTKEIQTAFKNLLKVSAIKSPHVFANSVKITAANDIVTLTATDIKITAIVTLKTAEVFEVGSCIIGKETLKLIFKLTDNEMIITDSTVISGKRNVNYKSLDVESYPNESQRNYSNHAFTLPVSKMKEIIDITYACSESETTPVLQGICFRENTAIACDRHRLATKTIEHNAYNKDIIIPADALNHISSFIDKKYNDTFTVDVSENDNYARVMFDNVVFEIYLTEGVYPDVSKIIPQNFTTEVKVKKSDIMEELKVLKEVTSTDKRNTVKIDITNKMKLIAEAESNNLTSEIDSTVSGEEINLNCNVNFLIDALEVNNNDYVTIKFTGKTSPFMIDSDALLLPYRVA